MKLLNIVGARPNFIKIAPIIKELKGSKHIAGPLVHTGQHYDSNMNHIFFEQLGISHPDYNLEVGSGTIPEQIADIMKRFEPILNREEPDAILVVGDVNSTIACAMVAAYKKIPVIHVEAGLRSFDRSMPEEINRVLTDQIAELLFTTERSAEQNLKKEGIPSQKIHFVGNVMVDSLLNKLPIVEKNNNLLSQLKLKHNQYALLTLHRSGNVDNVGTLKSILEGMSELAEEIPIVFAIHPRTEKRIQEFKLSHLLKPLIIVPPQPYLDTVKLMNHSKMVLTDSGGIQEETTVLGVPCLTLRENTERPITVDQGTNTLVGSDKQNILEKAHGILKTNVQIEKKRPELWDGCAAKRIVDVLSSCSF